tara:strand:+ start:432 stop:731 length:300 start_codon:yes stop_codon:yes gene_type:complete
MQDAEHKRLTLYLLGKVEGELLMEDNSVGPWGGERWIRGDDVGKLLCHLYETSPKVKEGIDTALRNTVTNPIEDWLYYHEDLVIAEAWEHDWLDALYPE